MSYGSLQANNSYKTCILKRLQFLSCFAKFSFLVNPWKHLKFIMLFLFCCCCSYVVIINQEEIKPATLNSM